MFKMLCSLLIIFKNTVWSQKKILVTKSTTENITIDGKFNEKAWINADVATDFVMFEPDNGKPISADKKTEIKIIYDNNAVYIAKYATVEKCIELYDSKYVNSDDSVCKKNKTVTRHSPLK